MSEAVELPKWIWVVIEKQGEKEGLLGQHDEEKGITFLPVFTNQEDGQAGLPLLRKKAEATYELQAMLSEEVALAARENHYEIFILDANGKVLERLVPTTD